MMYLLLCLLVIFTSTLLMEVIAILAHKYIMHGPGWFLHKSHHSIKHDKKTNFELNDLYFIIFSSPSIFCIIYGYFSSSVIIACIGIGIMIYGCIYIIFHDIIVHNRFGIKLSLKNSYIKKVKTSHMKHHSCKTKNGASNFGFLSYK